MKGRRVTATLTPKDSENLEYIHEATGYNRTDCVRKSLATQLFVDRTLREGRKILVEDGQGSLREVVWNS